MLNLLKGNNKKKKLDKLKQDLSEEEFNEYINAVKKAKLMNALTIATVIGTIGTTLYFGNNAMDGTLYDSSLTFAQNFNMLYGSLSENLMFSSKEFFAKIALIASGLLATMGVASIGEYYNAVKNGIINKHYKIDKKPFVEKMVSTKMNNKLIGKQEYSARVKNAIENVKKLNEELKQDEKELLKTLKAEKKVLSKKEFEELLIKKQTEFSALKKAKNLKVNEENFKLLNPIEEFSEEEKQEFYLKYQKEVVKYYKYLQLGVMASGIAIVAGIGKIVIGDMTYNPEMSLYSHIQFAFYSALNYFGNGILKLLGVASSFAGLFAGLYVASSLLSVGGKYAKTELKALEGEHKQDLKDKFYEKMQDIKDLLENLKGIKEQVPTDLNIKFAKNDTLNATSDVEKEENKG